MDATRELFERYYAPLALSAEALFRAVGFFHARGWAPATSTNYSMRAADNLFFISRSGVDKSEFSSDTLVLIDETGKALAPTDARPSAETALHLLLYENPECEVVLHTHSVAATTLSFVHLPDCCVTLRGLEVLKGVRGITTHDTRLEVPIFANAQDIPALAAHIRPTLQKAPVYGFLLAGHGLYVWGRDVAEARRHIEAFEFLFECTLQIEIYGRITDSR